MLSSKLQDANAKVSELNYDSVKLQNRCEALEQGMALLGAKLRKEDGLNLQTTRELGRRRPTNPQESKADERKFLKENAAASGGF